MVITLLRCVALRVPVIAPPSIRSTKPSLMSSVWTPSSRWPESKRRTWSGTEPIPAWIVAPSSIRSTTSSAIRRSVSVASRGGTSTSG